MSFFRGEEVIIRRKIFGPLDAYGKPTFTIQEIVVPNVLVGFEQTSTSKNIERAALNTKIRLYFLNRTVIEDSDIFVLRGTEWQKSGRQMDWQETPFWQTNVKVGVVVDIEQFKGNADA